jgi:hypothetical protein
MQDKSGKRLLPSTTRACGGMSLHAETCCLKGARRVSMLVDWCDD